MTAIGSAPTTDVSWVCAPAASATGVRDALLLIGIPENSPVARFAAAERDELAVLVDLLAAPDRERPRQDARVGRGDERDPERRRDEREDVAERERRQGRAAAGPTGSGADDRDAGPCRRSRTADTTVAPTTAMRTPGISGRQRSKPRMTARQATPIASATGFVSPSRHAGRRTTATSLDEAVAVDAEPEQLRAAG